MPEVPFQYQQFGGAAGPHEGLGPLDVAEFFSSEDSINVYIEKSGRLGQIKKILGYVAKNAAAITTNTGASAVKVVGLLPYRSMASGTTTRHLLAVVDDGTNEYEVFKSTDSAATFAFSKELSTSVGFIPDWAQMDNSGYLTIGSGVPQVYAGSSLANAGGTQSPTPSTAAATGTGALRGAYQYKLLSLKANKARQNGSVASTELRIEGKKVTVTWTADSDGDVIGYELYRTTGSGLEFYLVDYIDGRTTTSYTDNISDENLLQGRTLEEHGDAPPTGAYYVEAHKQRMWWGRTDANPRRAWYSDPGDADSVYANNYINFTDALSATDQLTGFTGNFTDALVVWEEYSVWAVEGTGEVVNNVANWNRYRTSASVGTVSHRSVAVIPAGAKYPDINGSIAVTGAPTLAYFTPYLTINLLAEQGGDFGDTIISHPKEDFLADVQFQYRHLVVVEHDELRGHVRWFFPHGSSQTVNNKGVMWDYRHGTWTELSQTPFASTCKIEKTNQAQMLLCGEARVATGGLVYENWSGNNYNGSGNNIQADFWTKVFFGRDGNGEALIHARKQWHWVKTVEEAQSSSQILSLYWYDGYGNASATARGSNTTAIDMTGTNVTHVTHRVDLLDTSGDLMTSEGIRLRLGDNADDAAWAVPVFELAYKILPGLVER